MQQHTNLLPPHEDIRNCVPADAVAEYIRLQLAHVEAVLEGDETRFVQEIREAGRRKDAAKYALIQHHQQHGCRPTPLQNQASNASAT